jgi:hypothetical protein
MSKKLVITERQLRAITNSIQENNANLLMKNKLQKFLEDDYEQSTGVKEIGNEFYNTALIKKKIDGNFITPKALCKYMQHSFADVSKKDIDTAIRGWYAKDYDKETGMRNKK